MTGLVVARRLARLPSRALSRAKRIIEGLAFWTGVSLPFLYIPMAVLGKGAELVTFVGLVAFNYLALIVGAGHDRDGE